jgi:hypothetical protein
MKHLPWLVVAAVVAVIVGAVLFVKKTGESNHVADTLRQVISKLGNAGAEDEVFIALFDGFPPGTIFSKKSRKSIVSADPKKLSPEKKGYGLTLQESRTFKANASIWHDLFMVSGKIEKEARLDFKCEKFDMITLSPEQLNTWLESNREALEKLDWDDEDPHVVYRAALGAFELKGSVFPSAGAKLHVNKDHVKGEVQVDVKGERTLNLKSVDSVYFAYFAYKLSPEWKLGAPTGAVTVSESVTNNGGSWEQGILAKGKSRK